MRGRVIHVGIWAVVAACASSPPRGEPVSATATPTLAPTTAQTTAPEAGTAAVFSFGLDPAGRGCKDSADCEVLHSCDCSTCLASKRMHIEQCPESCKKDPCSQVLATCTGGLCVAAGRRPPASLRATSRLPDVSEAGQALLDDPRIAQYFHERERPERVPLVVAWEPGVPKPSWNKFGRPVELIDGMPPSPPFLVPTFVEVGPSKATFNFWYEVEGALMVGELVKKDGRWTVVTAHVTERKR